MVIVVNLEGRLNNLRSLGWEESCFYLEDGWRRCEEGDVVPSTFKRCGSHVTLLDISDWGFQK